MALQTREQHIRRDKATSNICTAQVLLAVMAAMYAVWHGPEGIHRIARTVHERAVLLARALEQLGYRLAHEHFFDTVAVRLDPVRADLVMGAALDRKINLRRFAPDCIDGGARRDRLARRPGRRRWRRSPSTR